MRARIDVSEIEAQTKIRAKYLRALENEEWGLLPGPDVREELPAHLRAGARASTARRWSRSTGCTTSARARACRADRRPPPRSAARRAAPRQRALARLHRSPSASIWRVIVAADRAARRRRRLLEIGRRRRSTTATKPRHAATARTAHARRRPHAPERSSRCRCKPTAAVYVCLLGDDGRKLIPGVELQAGRKHADLPRQALRGHARQQLGDDVRRRPRRARCPPSSQAIGYSITKARGRQPLPAGAAADVQMSGCVSARAGIVVTGTEVLTRPRQRPQRPVAGRPPARARRRPRATRRSSATAPRTCARRCAFMAARGARRWCSRAAASGRPPTTSRPRSWAASRAARWCSTRRWRSASPRSCAPLAKRWPNIDMEAIARGQPQAGDGPRGGRRCSSRSGTAPGLVVPPPERAHGPTVVVLPGPAARAAADVGHGAGEPRRCARRSRARPSYRAARCCGCSGSPSRRSPRRCAWPSARASSSGALEVTTCLKRGEVEVVTRYEPARRGRLRGASRQVVRRAPRRHALLRRRQHGRRAGRRAAARRRLARRRARSPPPSPAPAGCWRRGSPTCPAPRTTSRAAIVAYSNEVKVDARGRAAPS